MLPDDDYHERPKSQRQIVDDEKHRANIHTWLLLAYALFFALMVVIFTDPVVQKSFSRPQTVFQEAPQVHE